MEARIDIERVLDAFLADGPTTVADRAIDQTIAAIDRTPQRRDLLAPWRFHSMNTVGRLASVAVVAVVAAGAVLYLNRPSTIPGMSPPAASPSPAPTASVAAPNVLPPTYVWPGRLGAGTYTTTLIWQTPVTVTFTVPDGWESRDVEVLTDPVSRGNTLGGPRGRSVHFWLVDNTYSDPCSGIAREPKAGPSVDDFAEALASTPGLDAVDPIAARLAGYDGAYLEFSIGEDAGCGLAEFHLWNTRNAWMSPGKPNGGTIFRAERERYRVWILDVEGTRYLVAAVWAADATEQDLAELQDVIDSIEINVVAAAT